MMIRGLTLLALLVSAATAHGQDRAQDRAPDEVVQGVYATIEDGIRREFGTMMEKVGRLEATAERIEMLRKMWTTIYYNRAAMFSTCAAEAEQYRAPGAPRVPAQNNLFLATCLEEKVNGLTRFTNMFSYASLFFPDRIERCGEASRLREQEKLLPPYEFLQFGEPKLYDFGRYNACLMTAEPTSPAAR
jgi:hypothetical protein